MSCRPREMYCGHAHLCVCLSVCLSLCLSLRGRMPTLLHRPRCNLGEWWGSPQVVHYWADLQSVHGLRCYGNTMEMHPSSNLPGPPHACRTRTLRIPAKTPLAGDKIDASVACAVPFCAYCGGVVTQTRNVSEYMLVLRVLCA